MSLIFKDVVGDLILGIQGLAIDFVQALPVGLGDPFCLLHVVVGNVVAELSTIALVTAEQCADRVELEGCFVAVGEELVQW